MLKSLCKVQYFYGGNVSISHRAIYFIFAYAASPEAAASSVFAE